MGRKKVYKDGELEHEFSLFSCYHKLVTIGAVLKRAVLINDMSPYKHRLIKGKYKEVKALGLNDYEKEADAIVEYFSDQHDKGDDTELNIVYEYCWKKLVPFIADNINYTEGETVKSLF